MPSGRRQLPLAELEAEIPRNGRIIGADGATTIAFHAGDDIVHLMTDRTGSIWTGYGDEASICAARITKTPAPQPHRMTQSLPGLIRWTASAEPDWYAGADAAGPGSWIECYALNVGGRRTWAYPYTGFPLVEIDREGVRCVRRSPVRSASGVIVAGNDVAYVAAAHPRAPGHYTVAFARIDDGPVEATATAPLLMPDGTRPGSSARRKACRDNRMFVQFDDPRTWYVIEI
jgi:hypothetical protein